MQQTYEVEQIVGKKIGEKNKVYYLVKWKGYSMAECTYEPLKHLKKVMDLVEEYEKKLKEETGAKEDQPKGEPKEENKEEKELKEPKEETPEMLKQKRPRDEKIQEGKSKKPRGRPKKNQPKETEAVKEKDPSKGKKEKEEEKKKDTSIAEPKEKKEEKPKQVKPKVVLENEFYPPYENYVVEDPFKNPMLIEIPKKEPKKEGTVPIEIKEKEKKEPNPNESKENDLLSAEADYDMGDPFKCPIQGEEPKETEKEKKKENLPSVTIGRPSSKLSTEANPKSNHSDHENIQEGEGNNEIKEDAKGIQENEIQEVSLDKVNVTRIICITPEYDIHLEVEIGGELKKIIRSNEEVKKFCKDQLIEFYESKVCFKGQKKN
ncbi:MAG: chromo domain-containing protein [archaeon]|nr:chromo domain-containing protein [archaeon]